MQERRTLTVEMDVPHDVTVDELQEATEDALRVLDLPGGESVEPTEISVEIG